MDFSKLNIKPFDGQEFGLWKYQMEVYFRNANLIKVIAGEDTATAKQEAEIELALVQALDRQQLAHIVSIKGAVAKWKQLLAIHERSDADSIQRASSEFFTLVMPDDGDVASFISSVNNVVYRLKTLGEEMKETLVVANIIGKLPERFSMFRVAWSSTAADDRTLANLTSRLLEEELRLKSQEPSSSGTALFVKSSKGHQQQQQNKKKKFKGKCHYCQIEGHMIKDCRKKKVDEGQSRSSANMGLVASLVHGVKEHGHQWLADSGATSHMCPHKEWFANITLEESVMTTATGERTRVAGYGSIEVISLINGRREALTINDVLFVPDLAVSLLSLGVIDKRGHEVILKEGRCSIKRNGQLIATGRHLSSTLYTMDFEQVVPSVNLVQNERTSLETWHRRLGHVHLEKVAKTINWNGPIPSNFNCEGCVYGKSHRQPFVKDEKKRMDNVGQLVHVDIAGPMSCPSIGGNRFFLLFKDDCSGLQFVYMMKEKSQVVESTKQFLMDWKLLTGDRQVQRLRSDNGTEFKSGSFVKLMVNNKIRQEFSVPYTPQQNGFIERSIRTVTEAARSMIHGARVKQYLWAEAVNTAVHVLNRVPSKFTGLSPLEMVTGKSPSLDHLREFGATAFAHIPDDARKKWEPKAKKMIVVGFSIANHSYRLFDESSGKVIISRDVTIHEQKTSFVELPSPGNQASREAVNKKDGDEAVQNLEDSTNRSDPNLDCSKPEPEAEAIEEEGSSTDQEVDDCNIKKRVGNRKPRVNYRVARSYNRKMDNSSHFAAFAHLVHDEPTSLKEAVESDEKDQWMQAMNEEMSALEENGTWILEPRISGQNVVRNKWVFRKKLKEDGSVDRFKARLVAKGFTQKEGVDYKETFAPVVRYDTVRVVLSFGVMNKMDITTFDVKTAFLNGDLEEDIWMEEPEGFASSNGTMVCHLKKSLYGLKQAPRSWKKKLSSVLHQFGLQATRSDPCLYVSKDSSLILACYVDDGLVLSKNPVERDRFLEALKRKFKITVGDTSSFVGLQIVRRGDQLFIHQKNYCLRVLERFKMLDSNAVGSPSESHVKLTKNLDDCEGDLPFQELVGSLMYLAIISRPDIAYAVNTLSQFMSNFNRSHWSAGKRILRYLVGCPDVGIVYDGSRSSLVGYCDSDFAGDIDSRRSRTGAVFIMNGGPVVWISQRQSGVTLSSTEAEFVAANSATTSIIWLRSLLTEIGCQIDGSPTTLWCDNQSAIKLIKNPEFHHRTKHVDIRNKFVREQFEKGIIDIKYVQTDDQLADIFTKSLSPSKFKNYLIKLNVLNFIY